MTAIASLEPIARIAALADDARIREVTPALAAPRPSPHLSRWRIPVRDDDGIVFAQGELHGVRVLFAAQDARYLGGAVGAQQALALRTLFEHARAIRPAAVVLLCASGGVRLHEANAAEWALARALSALLDVRAAGVPVLALATGHVFGGASVLACATDRIGMLPGTHLGLSGPKVIATARGDAELDPDDADAVAAIFGASARASHGDADLVSDDADVIRAWLEEAVRSSMPFEEAVLARHRTLDARLVPRDPGTPTWSLPPEWTRELEPVAVDAGLWRVRHRPGWVLASTGAARLDADRVHAQNTALLERVLPEAHQPDAVLLLVEDTPGHDASVAAERACLSRHLAHRAEILALLRHAGMRTRGLLYGCGHSAAFFVNALQAQELAASSRATVMAMDPAAVARVTRLAPDALASAIASDPVLGHDIACFAHWGELVATFDDVGVPELDALTRRELARS